MAKPLKCAPEIRLLPELRRDDLFLAGNKNNLPLENQDSLDDDSVSNLSRRMAHSFLDKDENFHSLLIKQQHASALDLSDDAEKSSSSSKLSGDGFYPNPSLTHQKLQLGRFHYLKQQQLIKNQSSAARRPQSIAKGSRPLGSFSSSDSPPSFGMRAVFLNPRKESSGTGVFLPRQPGCPNEPRKKQACLTALLPARVVQVLNLNLDELGFCPRVPSHGIALAGNQKRSSGNRSQPAAGAAARLPPEWTY